MTVVAGSGRECEGVAAGCHHSCRDIGLHKGGHSCCVHNLGRVFALVAFNVPDCLHPHDYWTRCN